ncbi:MAG: DUF3443 family protein [Gallionella sp.]
MASVLVASCSGGGSLGTASNAGSVSGTLIPPPTATGNTLAVAVDAGPVPNVSQINVAYVSVTVCPPYTTPGTVACQTIDHVALDTGSSGLRLLSSMLYSNLNLPAVTDTSGEAIGECVPFVVGTTWGSVRYADIYLGGEVARNVPIQDIGDQPGGGRLDIPPDCASYGNIQDTQSQLGSNGILGVGLFQNDCDACLSEIIAAAYYTCTTGSCANSTVSSAQVVQNPVALFAQDNNGVQIDLPAVSSAGDTILNGALIFGIGTEANNQLGSATVYTIDTNVNDLTTYGDFTTTYKGTALPGYIDSGSNALFFNDSTITLCSPNNPNDPWYCPPSTMTLTATNSSYGSSSGVVVSTPTPTIVNADNLFTNASVLAGNIGGWAGSPVFAWGLPFFFGRPVFTAIQGVTPPAGVPAGPYFAY